MKCIDAFKNLNISNQNNQLLISPCCISPTKKVDRIDFYNNEYLTEIRESWQRGEYPDACSPCKFAESNSLSSRRLGSNRWYNDHGYNNLNIEMISVDYWTGDTCNLRCAICGPYNSSAWKEELKIPLEMKKANTNYFWKDLDISTLKMLHFNGGEPLLNKEHIMFLKAIPNKSQVYISYNTNGTILPSADLLNLWKEFKLVKLVFSIDDIGERFTYQRYPASWELITSNLQWFIDNSPQNCMFAVNTSVGILNQANIESLNNWLKTNFSANRFNDATEHRQQPVQGLFALDADETRKKSIVQFLNDCDKRRGTNWKIVFPELVNTFKI